MATVKGDVHDIGKNIVGVVLACNNYEVDRPRRDGPGPAHPRDRARGGRRPDRAVRADHAVARGDAPRRRRDGARGLRAAAADRRRDDLADPHRGQDRAAVPRPGRPRRRCVAGGRRRGVAARRGPPGRVRGRDPRRVRDRPARARRARGEDRAAPDRRGAPPPAGHRLDRRRAAAAHLPRRPHARRLPARRAGRAHRLDAVLRDLGAERPLPGDPRRPGRGDRRRARSTRTPWRCSSGSSASGGCTAARRRRLLAGEQRRRRHRALHRRDPDRAGRHDPHAAPADGQAAGPPEPGPGGLHRAARDRPGRLRRRRSRSPPGTGWSRWSPRRRRSTTTTPRSSRRRSRTGWPRPSPSGSTSWSAASCGATPRTRRSRTRTSSPSATRASGRRPATRPARTTPRRGRSSSCSTPRRAPASS